MVQFNKRDLLDGVSEEEVAARWAATPWPVIYATAIKGLGVRETFRCLLGKVYELIDRQYQLATAHGMSGTAFVKAAEENDGERT